MESEPAYLSVMMREMGAGAVAVREVFSLELLETLPQPIHGLILLFRARKVAPTKQEHECPAHVWFANQWPGQNSCATLAIINILAFFVTFVRMPGLARVAFTNTLVQLLALLVHHNHKDEDRVVVKREYHTSRHNHR